MRVFVGPQEVAGIAAGLVAGLRAIGVAADLHCAYPHPFAYTDQPGRGVDRPAWPVRLWAWAGAQRRALPRGPRKAGALALQSLFGWCVLVWALPRYQAFVFLYGQSITNTALEGLLLRATGKRVVAVFVGSDARPPYIDGGLCPADRPFDAEAAIRAAQRQRRRVARVERYASVCVNAMATGHFHARPFVNWFALGIPRAPAPCPPAPDEGLVRVLHSPSHALLKGTERIRDAVQRLRQRGVPLELVTIEGRPNAEVLQALKDCHLVLDQLYSDTPMAAFAAEAASLGRPVIVGSCAAHQARMQVGALPLPPTVYINPDDLEPVLESLVADAGRRRELGAQGAQFIAEHCAPALVARRLMRLLQADIPAEWWCEPRAVRHLSGCGLSDARARAHVRAVIAYGGVAALQLSDKPELEQAFKAYAEGGVA